MGITLAVMHLSRRNTTQLFKLLMNIDIASLDIERHIRLHMHYFCYQSFGIL